MPLLKYTTKLVHRWLPLTVVACCIGWHAGRCDAAPLHTRVDELVTAKAELPLASRATDDEFLRRVYLDLAGTVPTAAEARRFLDDAAADKRAKLVDRLLAGPDYARHMAETFDVILMERRTRDDAASVAWRQYLQASFAANKPWDQLAREILCPNPNDETSRAAAVFYTKRLEKVGANPTDYPGLTRDVGRLFLGVDLKCAQCHNHKYIKDYKQADFQGLFAIVGQTFIRTDVKFPAVGEKPLLKKIEYVSVFNPEKKETGPRLPFGKEIELPVAAKGQEWAKPPDPKAKFPGVPNFSTLHVLADGAARADNSAFTRNIANRLWYLMMGRGLVNPLDLAHADNPPSHPELLALLADEFAAMRFDVKGFLRELALSETYQRSSLLPSGTAEPPPESYRVAIAKRMSAEQLARATLTATGELGAALALAEPVLAPVPNQADANAAEGEEKKLPRAKGPVSLREINKRFVAAFAGPAGEAEVEFAPSVAGALFISNDQLVLEWLKPRPGNLMDRLSRLQDPSEVADELYLSVLTRRPTEEERADLASYLSGRPGDRASALKEIAWSLLASTEFALNH